ncbi:MAG: hypothetical protein HYX25_03735 [Candidatus Solibacter usitatus]|nr:hypothetical protein [Candidatus Solibacter usitatus]
MFARITSILPGLALLGATLVAPLVMADEFEKKTVVHVTERVQLPNFILEPGQYVFRLMDNPDRHIVLIYDADGTHLVTKVMAVPNLRLTATSKTVFQFWETPAGQPKALRAWFYPGDNFGQEFVYPKTKSIEIAQIVHAPVLAVVVEKEAEIETAPIVRVDEKGTELPVAKEEVLVARNDPPAEPVRVAAVEPAPAPAELPHTASPYPLIALFGLLSLAAFGLMSRLSIRD